MELLRSDWRPSPDFYQRESAGVARGYFWAAAFWLVVGVFAGLTYSFQFVEGWGEVLVPPSAVHSVGKLRMAHSSIQIFGFLMNVFLGALSAVCGPQRRSRNSGRGAAFLGFWIIQLSLVGGVLGVLHGEVEALGFGEMPALADAGLICGWLFASGSILGWIPDENDGWIKGVFPWIAVAMIGGTWIQLIGLGIPLLHLPRDLAARWGGIYEAGVIHAFLVPLGLSALIYFMRLRLPYTSWNRGWLGLLALVYAAACIGFGRGLYDVEPGESALTQFEFVAQCVLFGVMALMFVGFGFALRHAMTDKQEPPPWDSRSMIWYTAGWIALAVYFFQRAALLFDPFLLERIRYTDWIAGHHHLVLLAGLGAWAFGLIDELWPELRRSESWRMPFLADLHLVLTLAGAWIMIVSLFLAGWVESSLAATMNPWDEIVSASSPFWFARAAGGALFALGQIFWLLNLVATRDRTLPKLRQPKAPDIAEAEIVGEGLAEL